MMTWQCDAPYLFFNLTSQLCQTDCGAFTVADPTTNTCEPCVNTLCYQCDSGNTSNCTDCASFFNRELIDGECVCTSGAMATESNCLLCSHGSEGCLNCTYDDGVNGTLPFDIALFTCTECNTTADYFMNGSVCEKCNLSFCLDCVNLTVCDLCNSSYDYSDAVTCIDCLVVGCYNCSASDQNNCTTCNISAGYYNNAVNWQCDTLCGDGIFVIAS